VFILVDSLKILIELVEPEVQQIKHPTLEVFGHCSQSAAMGLKKYFVVLWSLRSPRWSINTC